MTPAQIQMKATNGKKVSVTNSACRNMDILIHPGHYSQDSEVRPIETLWDDCLGQTSVD